LSNVFYHLTAVIVVLFWGATFVNSKILLLAGKKQNFRVDKGCTPEEHNDDGGEMIKNVRQEFEN